MKFCTMRWLEDVPVATRALEVWPAVSKFISALTTCPSREKPKSKSFKNLQEHILDPFVEVKLHFLHLYCQDSQSISRKISNQ